MLNNIFIFFTDFKSQRLLNMNIWVMQSSLCLFITHVMAVRHQKVLIGIFSHSSLSKKVKKGVIFHDKTTQFVVK